MIRNGFVLYPYHDLLPDYKICPFSTSDLKKNREIRCLNSIDVYLRNRFQNRNWIYTSSGREALNIALSNFNLTRDDCVTVLTTSGNYYISRCVTDEIEKFCSWSRSIEKNSKIIFVNHEFGFPYKSLGDLKKYNLPIIEDCAHSFFSSNDDNSIGTIGDFVIFSFSKMFPIQFGGLLIHKSDVDLLKNSCIDQTAISYVINVISYYLSRKENIITKRLNNYMYLQEYFLSSGLNPRFKLDDGVVPGVFMFEASNLNIELDKLKIIYYEHGVQCSVFYGEKSFFIPCHQNLNETDLDYFFEIVKPFINK